MKDTLTDPVIKGSLIGIAVGLITSGFYLSSKQEHNAKEELRRCIAQASASISDVPIQDFSQAHAACFNAKPRNL